MQFTDYAVHAYEEALFGRAKLKSQAESQVIQRKLIAPGLDLAIG